MGALLKIDSAHRPLKEDNMVESEYKFSWIYLLRNQSLLEIILQRRFAKEMESCVQVVSGLTIPLNNAKLSNAHHK